MILTLQIFGILGNGWSLVGLEMCFLCLLGCACVGVCGVCWGGCVWVCLEGTFIFKGILWKALQTPVRLLIQTPQKVTKEPMFLKMKLYIIIFVMMFCITSPKNIITVCNVLFFCKKTLLLGNLLPY